MTTGMDTCVEQRRHVMDEIRTIIRKHSEDDRRLFMEVFDVWITTDDPEEAADAQETLGEILWCTGDTAASVQAELITLPDVSNEQIPTDRNLQSWSLHVAKQIRKLREAAGWTQAELAARTKLTQSHISRIEKAHHSPSYKTIKKIADALGVAPSRIDPV